VGAALEAGGAGQSPAWVGNVEIADVAPEAEQDVRIFGLTGGRIGVSIRDFNDEELKSGKVTAGTVVEEVEADSPAQKAGFKAGDIIVEFDGERVRSTRQFMRLVQETVAGRTVQAAVTRDGQRVTLSVEPRSSGAFKYFDGWDGKFSVATPKVAPSVMFKRDLLPPAFGLFGSGQLGILVDELSPQLAEYFGAKEGVLVTTVRDNSNAGRAGVKAGDVITALNGGTVTTAADLRRRAQRLEAGDELTLAILRDKKSMTLKGKIEAPSPGRRSFVRSVV
jgi:serine protease Do